MITDELCAWLRLFFLSGEINKIRNEFQNKANIGYAYIDFVYDSVVYKLEPAAIAATKDMFHHIAEMIQKDLNGSMQTMQTEAFSAWFVNHRPREITSCL